MILVITDVKVKEREPYLSLAKAFAADVSCEKGSQGIEVYVDPKQEDRVVYVARWEQQEDLEAHLHGTAFQKHIPGMSRYFVSSAETVLESAGDVHGDRQEERGEGK